MKHTISYRKIAERDTELLQRIYATSRIDFEALQQLDKKVRDEFLIQQFQAQHTHYQDQNPNASFDLILKDDQEIGRLYVNRSEDTIHIIDIAILPEYRGAGVGGQIMSDILEEARNTNRIVRIYVGKNNKAMHLYQRLGFKEVDEHGVYVLMECSPD